MKEFQNNFKQYSSIFSRNDKIRFTLLVSIQILVNFLDLIGIALVGVVGAISIYGIKSEAIGGRTNTVLRFLNLEDDTLQLQVFLIGALAALVMTSKTIISGRISRLIILLVNKKSALVTTKMVEKILSRPTNYLNKYTIQEIIFATTTGVEVVSSRVVGGTLNIISDLLLTLMLFVALFIVNPATTLITSLIFAIMAISLTKYFKKSAVNVGQKELSIGVESNEKLFEALQTYRELTVHSNNNFYISHIYKLRLSLANYITQRNFMPLVSKLVFEITLLCSVFTISIVQFMLYDATHAIAGLAILIGGATRMAPAVLRLQQGFTSISSAHANSKLALSIIEEIDVNFPSSYQVNEQIDFRHSNFNPTINVKELGFRYADGNFKFDKVSLEFLPNQMIAIVGPSGSGKSTLVDLILGILDPESGLVEISGYKPIIAFKKWPGAVSYVSQDANIIDGTILDNVCLGLNKEYINSEMVWSALDSALISEFVKTLPEGLATNIGGSNLKVSGGQAQRICLARALYSNPKIIILDEATSALDSMTENTISKEMYKLKSKATIIFIAHRLSTVKNADKIIYIENGNIKAIGTFTEVRNNIPNFDSQARLMGI